VFRKTLKVFVSAVLCLFASSGLAVEEDSAEWLSIVKEAQHQTVYFNAWGGEIRTNRYLEWLAGEVESRFGIHLQHVKLADTAQAVSRILAEKQAGNLNNGSVDMLWANGENFAALKQNNLLYGPWAESLPNFLLLDADQYPEMREDFTVPVEGYASPWLRAQLVFYYDSEYTQQPPGSMRKLLAWVKANPGEFIYPKPPDFLGTTFLKQAVLELSDDRALLYQPVSASHFEQATATLWEFLDELHPWLLRRGRYFPVSGAQLRRLVLDREIALAFSFNPHEVALGIASGELPTSSRSYVLDGGTISNVSFVSIAFNSPNKAAATVVANFLLSPVAQLRAQDSAYLGSMTVLSLNKLNKADRQKFLALELGSAAPRVEQLNRKLQEPHPSWMAAIEQAWLQRYITN